MWPTCGELVISVAVLLRVQWGSTTIKQVDGCSLGPVDSCDYCDISNETITVVQPSFDWFDHADFPPLETSVRRDWTVDIEESPLSTPMINTPSAVRTSGEGI